MHICFICREYPPSLRGGGIASYQKEMAEGLTALGHRVTVICASDDTRNYSTQTTGNLTVIRLSGGDFIIPKVESNSLTKKFRTFFRYHSYRKQIRKAVEKIDDIDIIEVPDFGAESLYLQNLDIPVVVRLHTPALMDHYTFGILPLNKSTIKYYWQGKHEFKAIKSAQFISSCSSSLKKWTIDNLKVDPLKITILPNLIDTSNSTDQVWKPTEEEGYHILYVGTICDWKGCNDLCKAVEILHHNGVNVQLTMIGKSGSYAQTLQKQYEHAPWLDMKGFIPRNELLHRYVESDLVCFPSWWENFPMVCLEAMLNGAIVLGSNSGGMQEIIEESKNGFLITPKNPQTLAIKIKDILEMPIEIKQNISHQARATIINKYSKEVVLQKTLKFYQDCIKHYK